MKILVVEPPPLMRRYIEELNEEQDFVYEIVESAADIDKHFDCHNGFFDGVIAPNNAPAKKLREIGENKFVKIRELPIFVFASTIANQRRSVYTKSERITLGYRGSMKRKVGDWLRSLPERS